MSPFLSVTIPEEESRAIIEQGQLIICISVDKFHLTCELLYHRATVIQHALL